MGKIQDGGLFAILKAFDNLFNAVDLIYWKALRVAVV